MQPPAQPARDARLDTAAARRVLLLQAFETAGRNELPQWTADDRAWATRLARSTIANDATPAQALAERARHAMQRLAPRSTAVQRALRRRGRLFVWLVLAVSAAFVAGLAVDIVGGGQRIDLLSPPVLALLAWNAMTYVVLALPLRWPRPLLAAAARRIGGRPMAAGADTSAAAPMAAFHAAWLRLAAPLISTRALVLLHTAAAALALGMITGLYLRGLVLDYRAGWQSTFLDARQVHGALALLLKPAAHLTGIALPDTAAIDALRFAPEAALATPPLGFEPGSAAPWIHLWAATIALFVVLPRAALAVGAALLALLRAHRLALPLDQPYWQRLLRELRGRSARVQVLAHGAAPTPHALSCLQSALVPVLGADLQIATGPATAYGDEEAAAAAPVPAGTTLRIALFDLAATPEDDSHGAFVRALRAAASALPLVALADETAYAARLAALPARLDERRAAWRQWAQSAGIGLVCVNLAQPDAGRFMAELDVLV